MFLGEDECVIVPPNIVIEKANYIFDVRAIEWSDKVFQITYQRCCRNNTITNIEIPQKPVRHFIEIYGNAIQECNNSPVFKNFPTILICNQKQINFDHSATDSEWQSLNMNLHTFERRRIGWYNYLKSYGL
ncbi:MAG: hypothetical protein U0T36_12640 [Saprospiraceae bacterium]